MTDHPTVEVLPKDLKKGDTFFEGETPVWAAQEDAYLDNDDTIVVCKVQYLDGHSSVRRWSIFEERTIRVVRPNA